MFETFHMQAKLSTNWFGSSRTGMAMADPGESGLVALARVRWASSGGRKACVLFYLHCTPLARGSRAVFVFS